MLLYIVDSDLQISNQNRDSEIYFCSGALPVITSSAETCTARSGAFSHDPHQAVVLGLAHRAALGDLDHVAFLASFFSS